jgi:hypothetical protein
MIDCSLLGDSTKTALEAMCSGQSGLGFLELIEQMTYWDGNPALRSLLDQTIVSFDRICTSDGDRGLLVAFEIYRLPSPFARRHGN